MKVTAPEGLVNISWKKGELAASEKTRVRKIRKLNKKTGGKKKGRLDEKGKAGPPT